jgi:membrane protein YdbS with pleckstrin-like domain
MRLTAPGPKPPADINKYLLPHERQVVTVRRHPAVLIGPISLTAAGLILAAVLSYTLLRHNSTMRSAVWLGWLVLLLWLLWSAAEWGVGYFVVTSQRMILTTGLVTRKVAMMPLVKVTDMSFQRSALGRVLGYGEFILESAGQDQALRTVDHLPYPEQLYVKVCELLFPNPNPAPPEEEPPTPDGGGDQGGPTAPPKGPQDNRRRGPRQDWTRPAPKGGRNPSNRDRGDD